MDLSVDATLDDTNTLLKSIHSEFEEIHHNGTDDASVWGQPDVTAAMHELADNWWAHRAKIQERVKKFSDRVDSACATWSEAEKQLSESIETSS